jgi:hypothetical protein
MSKVSESNKQKFFPNEETCRLGLTFNVKTTKNWLRTHLKRHKIESKSEDKSDNVKIFGSHSMLTAADQVVCLLLVNLSAGRAKKETAGIYKITEDLMIDSIRLNKDFNFVFGRFLDTYDSQQNYEAQLLLPRKIVTKFYEKYAFDGGNSNINLSDDAYNFLMYVMLKNRIMLVETAFYMSQYAKKTSVDDRAILYAVKSHYVGELGKSMFKKLEEVSRMLRGVSDKDEEVEVDVEKVKESESEQSEESDESEESE